MKLTTKTVLLGLITAILCSASCEHYSLFESVSQIEVHNNTNEIILYSVSYSYPDTTLPDKGAGIKPMTYSFYSSQIPWEEVFSNHQVTKMSFFFFSPDTVEKYGWENVRTNYRILARKDFTLQELKDKDWTVAYP